MAFLLNQPSTGRHRGASVRSGLLAKQKRREQEVARGMSDGGPYPLVTGVPMRRRRLDSGTGPTPTGRWAFSGNSCTFPPGRTPAPWRNPELTPAEAAELKAVAICPFCGRQGSESSTEHFFSLGILLSGVATEGPPRPYFCLGAAYLPGSKQTYLPVYTSAIAKAIFGLAVGNFRYLLPLLEALWKRLYENQQLLADRFREALLDGSGPSTIPFLLTPLGGKLPRGAQRERDNLATPSLGKTWLEAGRARETRLENTNQTKSRLQSAGHTHTLTLGTLKIPRASTWWTFGPTWGTSHISTRSPWARMPIACCWSGHSLSRGSVRDGHWKTLRRRTSRAAEDRRRSRLFPKLLRPCKNQGFVMALFCNLIAGPLLLFKGSAVGFLVRLASHVTLSSCRTMRLSAPTRPDDAIVEPNKPPKGFRRETKTVETGIPLGPHKLSPALLLIEGDLPAARLLRRQVRMASLDEPLCGSWI